VAVPLMGTNRSVSVAVLCSLVPIMSTVKRRSQRTPGKRQAPESLAPARVAKRRKKKDSPKDDQIYEDTSDEELAIKTAAWMEHLNRTNTKFRDGFQILPTWFELFFEALEAKNQDSLRKASENIAQFFVKTRARNNAKLSSFEQAYARAELLVRDEPTQTSNDSKSLAKLEVDIQHLTLSKELVETLQKDWQGRLNSFML
jgi:hypothetical protein